MSYRELLIGAGHDHKKRLVTGGRSEWTNLTTLDLNPDTRPMVVADLAEVELPFKDSTFDEIHAYEVLEHVGTQGDYRFFFREFDEFARVLKPFGYFTFSSPTGESKWCWGDPGHTRHVAPQWFTFLERRQYDLQLGKTPMSDYRRFFKSNWEIKFHQAAAESNFMVLQNLK